MFNKFNALRLLLPEFDVTVTTSCDNEVLLGYGRVCHVVSVHVASFIHLCGRQPLHIQLLELQDCARAI